MLEKVGTGGISDVLIALCVICKDKDVWEMSIVGKTVDIDNKEQGSQDPSSLLSISIFAVPGF